QGASGAAEDVEAGRDVPGVDRGQRGGVRPSRGDVGELERGGAQVAHRGDGVLEGADGVGGELREAGAGALAGVAGEHEGIGGRAGIARGDLPAVQGRGAVGRGEDLAEHRRVDHAGDQLVADGDADRYAEPRQACGEV